MREEQQLAEWILNMPFCIFCKGSHKSEDCIILMNTVSRIEHLLRTGLCLVCMSHHTSLPCPRTTFVCPMCNHMNHHVAICYLQDIERDDIVDVYENELTEEEKSV